MVTVIGVTKLWQPHWFMYTDINKGVIIPLEVSYFLSKDLKSTIFYFGLLLILILAK